MTPVIVSVRPSDAGALDALMARCSPHTRYSRFFGPLRTLPEPYREAVLAGRPAGHDAVVARVADGVVALADLAAGAEMSELGVLVEDGWQRRGLGTALVDTLVARARQRGVRLLRATVLPDASALLGRLARRLPAVWSETAGCTVTAVYRLR